MRNISYLRVELNSLIQQQQQSNRLAEVEKELEATDESRGGQDWEGIEGRDGRGII